jgi:hemolysin activation/secretion protein
VLLLLLPTLAVLAAEPPPSPATAAAPAVQVERFRVSGNTLLEPAAIEAALAPFKGSRTLAELRLAAAAVQGLYAQAGYGGVIAYLPPQVAEPGVVLIAVVEGKVATVTVRGAAVFSETNVRASVPALSTGATPQVRRIDAQIGIANENPSKRVQVLLKPGEHPGEIAAELAVTEKPLQSMTFGLDNTGNDHTGRYRAGFTWTHANLTGGDDVLTTQYQTSPGDPGKVTVLGVGYRYPLPGALAVLDGYLAYSNVDAGTSATAAGDVRLSGRGNLAGLRSTWSLPRLGDVDQRLAVGLDRREYLNHCEVAGLPSGACGPAGASVTVTPLSLEYSARAASPVAWAAALTLQRNLGLGGNHADDASFANMRIGASPGYSTARASLDASTTFAERWQLRGRLALQWSGDALVSGEQFGLGGAGSVRGYEERELVGDRGALLSLELGGPELLDRPLPSAASLRPFAFADTGTVSNLLGAPCRGTATRCTLSSLGLGLQFEREHLQARLAVAAALDDAITTHRHDARAHAAVLYSF